MKISFINRPAYVQFMTGKSLEVVARCGSITVATQSAIAIFAGLGIDLDPKNGVIATTGSTLAKLNRKRFQIPKAFAESPPNTKSR